MPHLTAFAVHSHTSYDDNAEDPYHNTQLSLTIVGYITIPQLTALINLINTQLDTTPNVGDLARYASTIGAMD